MIEDIKNVSKPRSHKIKNSLGLTQAFKFYSKTQVNPLNNQQYSKIIRLVNLKLQDYIINGNIFKMPCRMGELYLTKNNTHVYKKDGKIRTTYPIDWKQTLELWDTDDEARTNKTLIRNVVNEVYKVHYNKKKANYKNQTVYNFKVNRDFKIKIKNSVLEGIVNSYIKV